jgi:hypothetical protein
LLLRLPGISPSGRLEQPHFLTVAGAAEGLPIKLTSFPFHLWVR